MKKYLFGALIALLLNCKSKDEEVKIDKEIESTIPKAGTGWDIYLAGIYRYGPSIIINDDGSIDAWFAAEGDSFGEKINNYTDDDSHTPTALNAGNTAAQRFSISQPFYALRVACPNWGSTSSNLTLTLYKWQTDYATTLAGTPVASEKYISFKDNQNLEIANEQLLPAGEYLWLLSEPSGSAGVWLKSKNKTGVTNYLNGQTVTGSFQAWCVLNKSSEALYWDQAAYRRSTDGGKTWTPDKMVLKPTEGTRDQLSICDPGAVKFGNYYYVGYTSTEDEGGIFNHAYVCRSTSPAGPWEKWDGNGWGGAPQPIVAFDGAPSSWGVGEPSMVILNNKIYFYYTWNDVGNEVSTTRLVTADVTDPNWPGKITHHGTVINKTSMSGADHCDVKYRDDIKKFQAIHTAARLTPSSYIFLWESEDGITFKKVGVVQGSFKPYLHNCGWSGDSQGHIDISKPQFISYAYGPTWGAWNTAWHPLTFK